MQTIEQQAVNLATPTIWESLNGAWANPSASSAPASAPRKQGEIRPDDVIYIRPHAVHAPGWMRAARNPSMPLPHPYCDKQATVLQVIPGTGMLIARVNVIEQRRQVSKVTAVSMYAAELILMGDA